MTSPLPFPIDAIRAEFPALALTDAGRARVYFDNPAGTQVPRQVLRRTEEAFIHKNANLGGFFRTTEAAGEMVEAAHQAVADLYNADSGREIIFGQNMTNLTFMMARSLARRFAPGDEIVLSRMDHDANVSPWLFLAEERGLTVRWMDFDTETYEFPEDALTKVLSSRTRLLAMGMASNCTGSIHDVKRFVAQARAAGALTYLDAVQFAPHCPLDVQDIGADFVVSSSYKWFGPHQGMLWGREELLAEAYAYKVRPAGDELPWKFEPGTMSHEGMAGAMGAIEYLAWAGEKTASPRHMAAHAGKRPGVQKLHAAMDALTDYEHLICARLIEGLRQVKGLTIRGIASANAMHRRVPTVSFTLEGHHPEALAKGFAAANIYVWSGHNYAIEPVGRMGLMDKGGVLRVGLAHYNTAEEVDSFLGVLGAQL